MRGGKFIYFIRPVGMKGPVKIGCSVDPTLRRSQLEAWSPFDLEVVATVPGDKLLEERFHAHFVDQWHRLEWFHWSQEMEDVIVAINSGTFDQSVLPRASGPIKSLKARQEKWSDLDHDYYILWRKYCERAPWTWPGFTVRNGADFSAMKPEKKQAVFDRLAAFLSANSAPQPRPSQTEAAA